jgi:hypothetical protein
MNTEENNKLISEFLNDKIIIEDTEYIISRDLPNMKFDSSWDWLMPVFKHMNKSPENGDNEDMRPYIYQDIDYFTLEIRKYEGSWDDGYEVIFKECGSRYTCNKSENVLDYAYYVVVEFIKWYNKNK